MSSTSGTHPLLSASSEIDAPASRLYEIIADYRSGHPSILPRPPFVSLDVEQGGVGAGTVILVEMTVLGRSQRFRATISEPEPGRTLVEANDTGLTTSFTVEPLGPERSRVTISTVTARPAPLRWIEGAFFRRLLRPVYRRELELLARVAGVTPRS